MIKIAVNGRLLASRKDTCRVSSSNMTSQGGRGKATPADLQNSSFRRIHQYPPPCASGVLGHLANESGRYRAITGKFRRPFRHTQQTGSRHDHLHLDTDTVTIPPHQQVVENVGPTLLEPATVLRTARSPRQKVHSSKRREHAVRRKRGRDAAHTIRLGPHCHPTRLRRPAATLFRALRVYQHHTPSNGGRERCVARPPTPAQNRLRHVRGLVVRQVGRQSFQHGQPLGI
jgi:hypothetical protein